MMNGKNILFAYLNGNYLVEIYNDGTKIRYLNYDHYQPLFPESIDLKITNFCDNNCLMCHEESSIYGTHARLDHPFLSTLKKGTELALGGGNPFAHPQLKCFLERMNKQGIICNITINQNHFVQYFSLINELITEGLIYGIGISIINDNYLDEIMNFSKKYKHTVLHVIAGIITEKIIQKLSNQNVKLLVLGYKILGRGKDFYNSDIDNKILYLKENILSISKNFKLVSFDNLAIKQLDIKSQIKEEDYNNYYMGDDGQFTMYVDLVKEQFSVSSTTKVRYPLEDDICEMFKKIQNK